MVVLTLIGQVIQKMENVLIVTSKKEANITVKNATFLKFLKDFVKNIMMNKDLEQLVNILIVQDGLKMEIVTVVM